MQTKSSDGRFRVVKHTFVADRFLCCPTPPPLHVLKRNELIPFHSRDWFTALIDTIIDIVNVAPVHHHHSPKDTIQNGVS